MNRGGRWTLRRVFRLPATSGRVRRELDDELRFHLEGRIEELMSRAHLARRDAELEARRRFGDLESYRLETEYIDRSMLQRRNKMELIDTIRREVGHAVRSLRRAPSFSLVALVTLALGLGATTTIFTLLDRVVLRPLPYPSADRLIRVATKWPGIKAGMEYGISEFMFFRFQQSSKTLEDIGVYQGLAIPLPAMDGADAEQVPALRVSASFFNVLGIRPELGRLFTADDERAQTTTGPILLSHDLWVRRYGADPNIVGKTLPDGSKRVIGVLPPSAKLPDESPALWLPLQIDRSNPPRNQHTYSSIALMKRGVAVDQALAELAGITQQITVDYPNTYGDHFMQKTGFGFVGRSLRDDVVGPAVVRTLWIVFASVAFVLLIAAANVANLFLVRIDARRREMAVRAALGASRSHLAVSYLCESCLLAFVAAAGAMGLSWVLLRVALHLAPSGLPRMSEVSIGWPSALFCLVVSLGAGVMFGVLPLARPALDIGALRDGGRSLTSSRSRHAARRTLVVSQIALAAVLLASAGLILRSFQKLHAVRPGF
ncbi:MAG TPA: FtsX-like permease family protein, partial [Gemmatimonadaceae bacterium]|nr:FtsX-like permease family protein [Gemmatimonadaceae bacterium]